MSDTLILFRTAVAFYQRHTIYYTPTQTDKHTKTKREGVLCICLFVYLFVYLLIFTVTVEIMVITLRYKNLLHVCKNLLSPHVHITCTHGQVLTFWWHLAEMEYVQPFI